MYHIVITEEKTVKRMKGHQWERIADSGNEKDGGIIYGYTPTIEVDAEVEVQLVNVRVAELDVKAIVHTIWPA